ncbi:glycosyltransferase family 4 protein [Cellulomonas chengniuliangii]|uniref:glycosyltransferase family 4 protein n=1 Tax=Cellulomonas chengniuliangii TaxID=2968084 RepID=UPI001D0E6845|nr:glycosyltransferase family 1 protein [Cellulomonas chengniuliangii]MCC2316953.1 glycosyltransferase family 4 protein [Cellulomonas chengniuliangii]
MLITLDGTPLLGPRTGIGRYVENLVAGLPAALARHQPGARLQVTTWTARGGRLSGLPTGVRQVGPRTPARLLRECWRNTQFPPIELLVGQTDVFHGTNFVSPPTRNAREVVTVHDLTYALHAETVSAASLMYRELVPRSLDRGAHVVTPTEVVAAAVRAHYGLEHGRVTAVPLGVDDAWFDAPPADGAWLRAHGLPDDYIVFVGSLDPRKNLPRLLEAHAVLRAADPNTADLVLAGPAGREQSLQGRAGVHLTGWLDDSDLRGLVAASRALVLPSTDEGFGLPVLEALATGRPVVVSDLPVFHEVAGPHAVTASPTDPESLASALDTALRADDDGQARASRQEWARQFTWERCADRTVEVYAA